MYLIQFGFKDRIEVGRSADGDEAVGVCELREDSDFVVVLEMGSNHGHPDFVWVAGRFKFKFN